MRPTDALKDEHNVIEIVLAALDKLAIQSELKNTLNEKEARDIIEFLRNFADKCHHGKEENHLFPLMGERGFPLSHGPVAVMLYEHEQGRELIRLMSSALEDYPSHHAEALAAFVHAARNYVLLLQQHIMKENLHLFPMAESVFDDADRANLMSAFEKVEQEELGVGNHERFHKMAETLAKTFEIKPKRFDNTAANACGFCQ